MSRLQRLETTRRKPTNLSLSESLVQDAKALGINLSQACEKGLAAEVRQARAEQWLRENQSAIEAWNAYVEEHGILLAEHRQF